MSQLIEKVESYHEQNVMMFSRIMEALKCLHGDENEPEFDAKLFPYKDVQKLIELDKLCQMKPAVKHSLVSIKSYL